MPGFSGALVLIHALMIWFPKISLLMATEGFDCAFTQLLLHPDQQKCSYYHVLDPSGNVVYFCHLSGYFDRLTAWA
eukprot:14801244-Heterocapsa_arctica.AAC.1